MENTPLNAVLKMTEAFHQKNMDGVMASYEDAAAVAFEPNMAAKNHASIEAGFEQFFALNPEFKYKGHQVIEMGDIALHISPWDMTGTTPDGQNIEQSGLSVAVLRKQENGEWNMIIDNPHGDKF